MHTKVREKSESVVCNICDKILLASAERLQSHVEATQAEHESGAQSSKFQCDLCGYFAHSQSNLNNHILGLHLVAKIFKCVVCDFTCSYNTSLKLHIRRMHEKRKTHFKCKFCDFKSFAIDQAYRENALFKAAGVFLQLVWFQNFCNDKPNKSHC
jgi:hypothetical protein